LSGHGVKRSQTLQTALQRAI